MSMYVRVKRKNQTIFLHVEPSESIAGVKQQVGDIVGVEARNIRFYGADKSREVPDGASIADQDVKSDGILYMVYRSEGGDGWESVDVTGGGELK